MKCKYIVPLLIFTFSLFACSNTNPDEGDDTPHTINVQSVSLNETYLSLEIFETFQLEHTISPSNATNKNVSYTSDDLNIATVSNTGLVTAVDSGECVITVTTEDKHKTATCLVSVYDPDPYIPPEIIPVTDIELDEEYITLKVGEEKTLVATIIPSNATNKGVTFESNNEEVATISNTGKITAVGEGQTYITATAVDGGLFAECIVNVLDSISNVKVTAVHLNTNRIEMTVGETDRLIPTVLPTNATNKKVSFASSKNTVVSVDEVGNISALKAGKATITVTTEDQHCEDTCDVIVSDIPILKEARMQDTAILHCWNWSANTIKSHLDEIKEAGFKTIQLSPFQPQKDPSNGYWSGQWWKLYQPLGFNVATSGQSTLGTKQDLISLCSSAKEKGIDVIMDVVANHLASEGAKTMSDGVKYVEPEIYNQHLLHDMEKYADDSDPESVVRGSLGGLNDLQTENPIVQNRVISLLKEYIDCGVNGFRFDAAKHIETPDDNFGEGKDYSSNFWPNVLGAASSYASSKNLDEPYYYGEILNSCGTGRSFSSYTKYMSVLDSKQSQNMLKAVVQGSTAYATDQYNTQEKPSKLVLWAESHDTYANDSRETTDIKVKEIHKTYVMQASRKDAAVLYFARPGNMNMGEMGAEDFKNAEIKAINNFHNIFVNQSEDVITTNGCFVNVRGNLGAAIVNLENSGSSVNLTIPNLEDGNYVDLVTNQNYVVSENKVTVTLTNDVCVLQNKDKQISKIPEITFNSYDKLYSGSQSVSFTAKNATEVSYSINDGSETAVSGNTISLPASLNDGKIKLTVYAGNEHGRVNKSITLFKTTSLIDKDLIIYDVPNNVNILCWAWKDTGEGKWYDFTKEGSLLGLDMGVNNNFIIVLFPSSVTSATADWDDKLAQTDNISLDKRLYNYLEFGF